MRTDNKGMFWGYVIKDLSIEKHRLENEAEKLRESGDEAKVALIEQQIKVVQEKIDLAASVSDSKERVSYVDPSNRTVTVDDLTFHLKPGSVPEHATITNVTPYPGPVAGSWDVYLNDTKVGWFSVTEPRNDGLCRVAEARTYVSSLPDHARADFIALAWVGSFLVGESPLPNRRK